MIRIHFQIQKEEEENEGRKIREERAEKIQAEERIEQRKSRRKELRERGGIKMKKSEEG